MHGGIRFAGWRPLAALFALAGMTGLGTGRLSAEISPAPSPSAALAGDWHPVPDDELLVMTLAGGRRVVIRLAPAYAPEHVANVRAIARARWWDGESVYRVQDNWVVQWGDATEKKPLPEAVKKLPAAEYEFPLLPLAQRLSRADAYSHASGISADGWPIASDGTRSWIAHCYGTVGVARDAAPDTGTGAELFMPLGGSARRLDRNYTIVGRVIDGAHHLSALPRSLAKMGVYDNVAERTPILSVRLASDMPAAERPHYLYRAADNPRFAAMIAAKEQPQPPMVGLGGVDVCDVPLEVRPAS